MSATARAIRFDLYSEDRADANQDFTVLHNAELVQLENGFPVATLADTPGSYAATLDRLRRSELVTQGLSDAAGRPF